MTHLIVINHIPYLILEQRCINTTNKLFFLMKKDMILYDL